VIAGSVVDLEFGRDLYGLNVLFKQETEQGLQYWDPLLILCPFPKPPDYVEPDRQSAPLSTGTGIGYQQKRTTVAFVAPKESKKVSYSSCTCQCKTVVDSSSIQKMGKGNW
jgi:hypothetical protein